MSKEEERFDYGSYYKKYRPKYPLELYKNILEFIDDGKKETSVDFACGNGQSTEPLCNYFDTVIGIDPSSSQIENGINKGNSSIVY